MAGLLALLSLPGTLAAVTGGAVIVGNGGEGVYIGDQIVPRDFVLKGRVLPLSFGDAADLSMLDAVKKAELPDLSVPQDLLARKLADLNRRSPMLGNDVLAVLQSLQLVFTSEPLIETVDNNVLRNGEAERTVQLATRVQTRVSINRAGWEQLTGEFRVGLLVHEAIYALVKLTCAENSCREAGQSLTTARFIVTGLFAPFEPLSEFEASALDRPTAAITLEQMDRPRGVQWLAYQGYEGRQLRASIVISAPGKSGGPR